MSANSNNNNSNVSNIRVEDPQPLLTEYPDNDTFRILIVTDTHLGHLERDEIRRYDSFRAFDEALSIGKQYNVDFVLHAGDLFDKNQPSRFTMVKTLHILRKHCLGNKPIHFQIVSDQSQNFPSTGKVNYEDPNYNISLPIFIQHGNHDDPAGLGNHAALEQLCATNLVNYVGRVDDLEDIKIFPILMKKGITKLALYPLGFIRDERLHRAFLHHKVKWIKPKQNNNMSDWFNIAMLHQNRTRHTQQYKDCIPEEFLPKFLDIAYWGHEHECLIDLSESLTGNFFVTQPGSTVITSLSKSESKPKYCGILEIKSDECRLIPFKLKTIRPFLFDDIVLDDHFEHDIDIQDIDDFLKDKINTMIMTALEEYPHPSQLQDQHLSFITNYTEVFEPSDNNNNAPYDPSRLPIIRLRVDHTNFPKIRAATFGQHFMKKVANVDNILLFHKKSSRKSAATDEKDENNERQMRGGSLFNLHSGSADIHNIEDIVTNNITSNESDPLNIFPELDLLKSIQEFVDKEDPHSIEEYCDNRLDEITQKLIETECLCDEKEILKQSKHFTNNRRIILRQQRSLQLLQKEQLKENEMKKDIMDINEVKMIAGGNNNNNNRNKNVKHEIGMSDSDNDEIILPKKKKANLNSFGLGAASQKARDDIINSQISDDDLLEMSDLDIKVKNNNNNNNEPMRKKRKLNENKNINNISDSDGGNDVINSLLGFDDDDDDEDVDMNRNRNKNKNKNKNRNNNNNNNRNDRVLRSQRSQKIGSQSSLDNYGISVVNTQRSMRSQRNNTQIQNMDEDEDDVGSTQTQRKTQRKRRAKKNVKAKKNAWGNLLNKRSNR
eukprot:233177_1